MKLYRLCNQKEIDNIFSINGFENIDKNFNKDILKNDRVYDANIDYMQFFDNIINILYLNPLKDKYICIYDLPDDLLKKAKQKGCYNDFLHFRHIITVDEYNVDIKKINFYNLRKVYKISANAFYKYVPNEEEILSNCTILYDLEMIKDKIKEVLSKSPTSNLIRDNIDIFFKLIPEIKYMIGFNQRNPYHNLDVWEHTLKVIDNLNKDSLDFNLVGILHDIGKPFSYQDDGDIRHFKGHAEKSAEISRKILQRLDFDDKKIDELCFLIRNHTTTITEDLLTNETIELYEKLLYIQYCDAGAYSPEYAKKVINKLHEVRKLLNEKKNILYSQDVPGINEKTLINKK